MTITDATHALATRGRRSAPPKAAPRPVDDSVRLVDLVACVEPSWVEAVAVVQAVCAQLKPGEAAPALEAIRISTSGTVSFPPAGTADTLATVRAMGQLLAGILRSGDCPLPVWEASERARRAPATADDVRVFREALACLPPAHGPRELAQFVKSAAAPAPLPPPPVVQTRVATGGLMSLWARAKFLAVVVAMSGIGAGVSVGALLAARTLAAPVAPRDVLADGR
ncbi:MAG: hypothetical protein JNL48_06110 [Acidobacteria bacterium]|nr:hypothetical protein [Acidobacteriota bacterium]